MNLKAHEIVEKLQDGSLTSEAVVRSYLDRIEQVDGKVQAFISVNKEQAIAEAISIDNRRSQGEPLPYTAGLPIAIKDNICTKGIKTTCGSKMLEHFVAPYDATVTQKIKEAGMIILGKLNMDEFAMGSSNENSAFFPTKNPWNLAHVPGGSSGGSAAAVAAGMTPIALGSDTGGSIRQPASYCGVVGIKPTYGTVSRSGLVAFASSLDQIGPLTNSVKDAALTMNIITGFDPLDSSSVKVDYPDYMQFIGQDIKGMKVALPKEYFGEGIAKDVKKAVLEAAKAFEEMGAIVSEVSIGMTDLALPAYYIISSAEASSNLARFDGIKYGLRASKYDNLTDLYKQSRDEGFGYEVKRRIMLGTYALSSGYYDAYYKKAQQLRTVIKSEFDRVFEEFDVVLTPTGPTTAFKIGSQCEDPIEMYMNDICTVPVNIAGLPGLSMNCGFDENGLPIGMQLISKAFNEGALLKLASAFENAKPEWIKYPVIQ